LFIEKEKEELGKLEEVLGKDQKLINAFKKEFGIEEVKDSQVSH
jgi:hypothetical protein